MATITVNGTDLEIGDGERLNCVQAAERAGVEVPHYCWHPALTVVASCRMCLVEVGDKKPDGTVAMMPQVKPACQTPAKHGTVIVTNSAKAKAAQAGTLEQILIDHPLDCPICDQAGECFLQDYSYKFGKAQSRLNEPKTYHPDKTHIGDQITLFTDRCVMCSRCVRFTREISGTGELQIVNRGNHAEIDIFPGEPCNNKLAGNVVDICPVGALCSKDFLYKQRVWWLQSAASVCPGCSTGCSINVDANDDKLYRLKPRHNPAAQGHFMCDEGRFGFKYLQRDDRLKQPTLKGQPASWDAALSEVKKQIAAFSPAVVAIFSPMMATEEAFLLASWFEGLSKMTQLALGPVPVVGADDLYPKSPSGQPLGPTKFTIRAEKAPNRLGVEAILENFEGKVMGFAAALAGIDEGRYAAAVVVGGYPAEGFTEADAKRLRQVKHLTVLDILPNALTAVADVVLPGAGFAERGGSFVNHAGLAQQFKAGVRPPGDARTDGRILLELAGRTGLYNPSNLRKEIAATIPALRNLAAGELGDGGVKLDAEIVPAAPVAAGS